MSTDVPTDPAHKASSKSDSAMALMETIDLADDGSDTSEASARARVEYLTKKCASLEQTVQTLIQQNLALEARLCFKSAQMGNGGMGSDTDDFGANAIPPASASTIKLLSDHAFSDVTAYALVKTLCIPAPGDCVGDVRMAMFPSHLLGRIMARQLSLGLLLELHDLSFAVIEELDPSLPFASDASKLMFWISNMHQYMCIVDTYFRKESVKSNTLPTLIILTRIQEALASLLKVKLVPSLLQLLCADVEAVAPTAVLGTSIQKGTSSWYFWGSAPQARQDSDMSSLNQILSFAGKTMRAYNFPDYLYTRVMLCLLHKTSEATMTHILSHRWLLSPKICEQMQWNLNTICGWYDAVGLYNSRSYLETLFQIAKVVLMPKQDAADFAFVLANSNLVGSRDLYQLLAVCVARDSADNKLNATLFMSPEFEALLKNHAAADLSGAETIPEELTLEVEPVTDCCNFVPAFVELPFGYQSALF
ncbi:hypothetical protein HDU81_004363 [Chytriomyces hyalinus]|nr:hypothetical protein HDU81_004363 [Chytriomyces hyalinus]